MLKFGPSIKDTRGSTAELTKLVRQQAGGVGQGPRGPQNWLKVSVLLCVLSSTFPAVSGTSHTCFLGRREM